MKTAAIDSTYAWWRLAACLGLTTVGSAGMFVVVVAIPAFEAEFLVSRGGAAVPYTMIMVGFGLGGVLIGRIVDRWGIVTPLLWGTLLLGLSYAQAAWSTSLLGVCIAHIQIGCFGCAVVFAPLIADVSKWFVKRRGLAVAICASGNYVSGTIWPLAMQDLIAAVGWRQSYVVIGVVSVALMLPLIGALLRRPEGGAADDGVGGSAGTPAMLGLSPRALMALLCLAGVGCCMAMAMPQVHIVSMCGDRGYGLVDGARMLSVMLGFGIVSRLGFGWISDRLGGLRTIIIGSALQCIALVVFLPADSLRDLYFASALFGLFQGGIVPCYALIVREFFPESEAGSRLGWIILATLVGMAVGGWVSGAIYDWTGSYTTAFIHGIGWNLLNISVFVFLLTRDRAARRLAGAAA